LNAECSAFLDEALEPANVLSILKASRKQGDQQIAEKCMRLIDESLPAGNNNTIINIISFVYLLSFY